MEQCRDAWFSEPGAANGARTVSDAFVARFHRCILPEGHFGNHECECGDTMSPPEY